MIIKSIAIYFMLLLMVACDNPVETETILSTDTIEISDTLITIRIDTVTVIDTVVQNNLVTGLITYYNYNKLGELTSWNEEFLVDGNRTEYITYNPKDVIILHQKYIYKANGVVEVHRIV